MTNEKTEAQNSCVGFRFLRWFVGLNGTTKDSKTRNTKFDFFLGAQRQTALLDEPAVSYTSGKLLTDCAETIGKEKSPRADGLMPVCRRALWKRGLFSWDGLQAVLFITE